MEGLNLGPSGLGAASMLWMLTLDMCTALLACGAEADELTSKLRIAPLRIACQEGHEHIARLLINHGCDIHRVAEENGSTPLFMVCVRGHLNVATLLVDKGAKIDQATNDGATPLITARQEKHTKNTELQLNKGKNKEKEGGQE